MNGITIMINYLRTCQVPNDRCATALQVGNTHQVCSRKRKHKGKHRSRRTTGNYTQTPWHKYTVTWK
jgi:hypothetical protein